MLQQHLEKLGYKARDRVTGIEGVITTVSYDLYGCIQAVMTLPIDESRDTKCTNWMDIIRLEIISTEPVMQLPDFTAGYVAEGRKGSADKPAM